MSSWVFSCTFLLRIHQKYFRAQKFLIYKKVETVKLPNGIRWKISVLFIKGIISVLVSYTYLVNINRTRSPTVKQWLYLRSYRDLIQTRNGSIPIIVENEIDLRSYRFFQVFQTAGKGKFAEFWNFLRRNKKMILQTNK